LFNGHELTRTAVFFYH